MSIEETFYGFIETTQDSLLVFEACRRCLLPKISRRLQEGERQLVRSGSVFVFDEQQSGIKRWTDGLIWSPSRILGNFLIYRELHHKRSRRKRRDEATPVVRPVHNAKARNRQLTGSLSESYDYKANGLIKKTMSLTVNGVAHHLVSYYHPDDVLAQRLHTPSSVVWLANLNISSELLASQNFRIPPFIEPDQPAPMLLISKNDSQSVPSHRPTTSMHSHDARAVLCASDSRRQHETVPHSTLNHSYNLSPQPSNVRLPMHLCDRPSPVPMSTSKPLDMVMTSSIPHFARMASHDPSMEIHHTPATKVAFPSTNNGIMEWM